MRPATPTCVYRVDAALIELLDTCLGPPLDSYVRGWQVWLEHHGPNDERFEWRLHPPARFRMPAGVNPHDLFDVVLQGVADAGDPAVDDFAAGRERRTLAQTWEVLEVFPADGDDIDPDALADAVTAVLRGRVPDAAGRADHDRLGDLWKGRHGDYSVGSALLQALSEGA
jgi:hypothetical protein